MKSLIENEIRKYYKDKNLTVQHLAENLNICQSYLREIVNANFTMSPQKLIETMKHLKLWKGMFNFAENVLISFIKLMFNWKLAKEYHSYIKLDENDSQFLNQIYFYHFCELIRLKYILIK